MKRILVLLLAIGLGLPAARLPAQEDPAREALELVASTVRSAVEPLTGEDVHGRLVAGYRTLRLLDEREAWRLPLLEDRARSLLPRHLDGVRLAGFVDMMADTASANPYLMSFLARAREKEFPVLRERVESEGAEILPDVVVHAVILDRLTTAMIDDYRISEALREYWKVEADARPTFWRTQSFFAQLKTRSVNLAVDRFNRNHREGKVHPRSLGFTLPFNILEAVGADLFLAATGPREARAGHLANARAGLSLAWNGPQGAGPARFSRDGKLLELQHREAKAWNDLYATWNMSFVTMTGRWPFFMTKLVIPSVNDHASDPGTYMNRRGLALETHMYLNGLQLMDGSQREMDWTDPALRALWGVTNRESARDYARKVHAASNLVVASARTALKSLLAAGEVAGTVRL